jgi:hypothetical protein
MKIQSREHINLAHSKREIQYENLAMLPSVKEGGIPPTKIFFVLVTPLTSISSLGTVLFTSTWNKNTTV